MEYNKSCVTCNIAYTKGIPSSDGCNVCKTSELENWKKKKGKYILNHSLSGMTYGLDYISTNLIKHYTYVCYLWLV